MPSTFKIAPQPVWNFIDQNGRLAANGRIKTFSSLDQTTPKAAYKDVAGNFPYPAGNDGIPLDGTGAPQGLIYWEDNGVDLYYLQIVDSNDNLIREVTNYPISGGGGSTPVTTSVDIENHIINGQFHFIESDTTGDFTVSPVPANATKIAPASGFFKDSSGEYVEQLGSISGWSIEKTGGSDAIDTAGVYVNTGFGLDLPNAPSSNAPRFFSYTISAINSDPYLLIDLIIVIPDVRTFTNKTISISYDVKGTTPASADIVFLQSFGTGGTPSSSISTSQTINYPDNFWERQTKVFNVPNIVGKTLGSDNNHFVAIRFGIPKSTIGTFSFTNLQAQIGSSVPTEFIYQTYAQTQYKVIIDLFNSLFPTGFMSYSIDPLAQSGWIVITDDNQTIGSEASLAVFRGKDKQQLYTLIYNQTTDSQAPVTGGRGASAEADFNANKPMRFPQWIGRVAAPVGTGIGLTPRAFGDLVGEETHLVDPTELPYLLSAFPSEGPTPAVPGAAINSKYDAAASRMNVYQPTSFWYMHLKL